jgi:hypothetical protein
MSDTKKESKESVEAPSSGIHFTKAEDFISDYANNSVLQSSNWDLKIVFGHLDMSVGLNDVVQTMAVTIPWAQAKVMHYYLTVHLIGHEAEMGRIIVPSGIIGELPKEAPAGANKDGFQKIAKVYEEFMAENPEAQPKK